jgi:hypothetical protein
MRHHPRFAVCLFAVIAVLFAFSGVAMSQEINGSIEGVVRDANGAAVKGATITVTDTEKKLVVRTATTNEDGGYSARDLHVGMYDVTVEASGFKKHIEGKVQLNVGAPRTLNITLEVGNVSEVVTVASNPVAVELSTPAVATIINGDQARELSLNNRNWVQLITLAPGVSNNLSDQVYVGTTNPSGQANTMNISVNGARSSQNTYTIDGADVTDRGSNITIQAYPSVDSIAEFKVDRSLYPAETGRSGGGQINVVTRSGGDRFHGSGFEFVRNQKLNANDFITNRNAPLGIDSNGKAIRAPFRYNDFGGTIGGPVILPRFGEGGRATKRVARTYFFFSEEARRDRRYPTLSSTAPDFNARQGIFPVDICLSASTAATTGAIPCTSVLPAGTPLSSRVPINSVAQAYLSNVYNKLPAPNQPNFGLLFPTRGVADFRQEIIRLDHQFGDKASVYYRFENDKIPTIDVNSIFSSGSGLPGVSTSSTNSPGRTHTVQFTDIVRPNLVIVGRWNYGYGAILSNDIGSLALANSPITPPLAYPNTRDLVPTVSGNGFSALAAFGNYNNFSYKHNFAGDLTWTRSKHTLKFGGQYSYYRKNENALAGSNQGVFSGFLDTTLTSAQQASVAAPGAATQATNLSTAAKNNLQLFANFLMGTNVSFSQAQFDYTADLRQKALEAYGQDEFKFRPNLSIYFGVRYSYFGAPIDKNGRLSNFDPALFSNATAPQVTGAGNRVAGTGNFCDGMIVNSQNVQTAANGCVPTVSPFGQAVVKAPKGDFAPRFGLAWDPFKKGKTSIRTGYGIYYDQVLNGTYEQNIGQNPPYQATFSTTLTSLSQPVPTGTSVTAAASLTSLSVRAIQPDWKDPYMQHWSLEWQQTFWKDTILDVGYFGSKGTHLMGAFELNELAPGVALASKCATGTNTLQTAGVTTIPCQNPGMAFTSTANSAILDQIRPFRGYRSINIITPQFNSNYNSLQVFGSKRLTGASQLNVAYTWSKNITDNQNDRSNAPENSYNIRTDRGLATLDRRHIFTANYIYDLPFFKSQHGFAGKTLGGWEISGIATFQSGLPFTATTSSFDAGGLGNVPALIAGNRPNMLCDPNSGAPHTFLQFFNTQCFTLNPTVTTTGVTNVVGNAPRGGITGPSTKRFDFSLFKNIALRESVRVQLRAEAFNIFNHTNFQTIASTNVTSGVFGQISAVRDPRTIQLGIKLFF